MNSKIYWKIRQTHKNFQFQVNKTLFILCEKAGKTHRFSAFSRLVFKSLLIHIFASVSLAAILYMGDHLLFSVVAALPIEEKTAVYNFLSIDTNILLDIVIGGLGVAGVILGLYCSNISSIFSSKYTNAPETISSAFQKDIITNRCIKQIVGYIIFCVILLLGSIIGLVFSYISILALLLLTIRMIITFGITGNRTYQLSNTYKISDNIYPEIYTVTQKLSNRHYFAKDPNFQNHYRKICAKQLDILKDIALYNKDNPINQNSAMLFFSISNLALIQSYWEVKEGIYYNSFWYRTESRYQKWHIASDTEISMALKTGLSLQAKSNIKNAWWFEDDLLSVNDICIDKLCADKDLSTLYSYLCHMSDLSENAITSDCLLPWTNKVTFLQQQIIHVCTECAQDKNKDYITLTAAIPDVLIGIYLNIIIGINRYLQNLKIDTILNQPLDASSYEEIKTISKYYNNGPIEDLFKRISTEITLEGKRITPDWYIKQVIAYCIFQSFNKIVDVIDIIYTNVFDIGKQFSENECYLQGATVLSRLFELSSKSSIALSLLESFFPQLEALHFEKSVVWEECHLTKMLAHQSVINKTFPSYLIKCCSTTALLHWRERETIPDYLGHCYNHLCEYLVSAIEQDNFEAFKSAYSGFWMTMLLYQEYVREDVSKIKESYQQNIVFHVATAPIIEYAKISGLAVLWGEFSGSPLWRGLVQSEIELYVSKDKQASEKLEKISEMATIRKHHLLGIGNRDTIQTNWDIRIANAVRTKGFCQYEYRDYGVKFIKTDSRLLKAFCGTSFDDFGFMNETEDVYFILYLNKYVPLEKQYKSDSDWEEDLDASNTQ